MRLRNSRHEILLDENLPRKLVAALRAEGHHVESVHTLRMQGLDNGALYRLRAAISIYASRATLDLRTTCDKAANPPDSSYCG